MGSTLISASHPGLPRLRHTSGHIDIKCYLCTVRKKKTDIMKYTISLEYLYHTSVEVEADSFEDAVEKAIENPQIGSVPEYDLEDPEPTYAVREDG